jgi:ATP-dependent DNA helicase RecG
MEGDVVISGKIVIDSYSKKYQIVNPDIVKPLSKIDKTNNSFSVEAVYPLTNGISNSKLKKMIEEALKIAEEELKNDWMDSSLLKKNNWPSLLNSLKYLHSPKTLDCLKITNKAYERLAFDEILCLYLNQLRNNKDQEKEKKDSKYMLAGEKVLTKELEKQLPFTLTKSQRTSINDIFEDVADDRRMMRLVQGDVGSGKTIVAIMAMLRSVESGKQACLLAPTEILANQHYSTITSFLTLIQDAAMNFNTKTKGVGRPCIARLITGSTKPKERDEILNNLKEGSIDILVGTHSLLGEKVIDSFQNLGLAVIDEEQRFGVNQRDILAKKTNAIFTSATPIPRSLMLLLQEDYSISTLLEKPPAKRPTQTVLIGVSLSEKIIERIKANLPYGSKIFWITPCLNPSPTMPGSSAMERINQLSSMFPGKVALLHGKMSSDEKKSIMANFSASDTPFQILVATSVVEVGIDVPDASICVIDHAENFGLSQLHQIRGRVGRGAAPPNERLKECYCVLLFNDHQLSSEDKSITDIDIYKAKAAEAQSKLQILVNSNDGFEIAEADFRIRGPGDVFGVRQHGFDMYKFAQVNEHTQLFADARIVAKNLDTGLLNVNDQQKGTLQVIINIIIILL